MAAQGPAKPVHIRATRDPAVKKRMGDLLVMHTISEAQNCPVYCLDCEATAARHANGSLLLGFAKSGAPKEVRNYRVPVQYSSVSVATISDFDERTRRHCRALPNIIQLIPWLGERVALDPDSPQDSRAKIAA
jgi:hypothetical protein